MKSHISETKYDKLYRKTTLYVCLKQLEFISQFEMYLNTRKSDDYSLQFLQKIDSIKRKAQINTLNSIKHCKTLK